ncbi:MULTISPECIES: SDR family oxidoreductase [unclassified Micromonospora]|uniref:SDR family oxidoreductase n=1 Tax=unclassified Micromonospora TaxID=2617518 RepID=UPI00103356F2|nr:MULTISPECIES: SDR family oxidoreductase [unclassified Micromonospora]QKW14603.1 SDR family oxidoreductase [Verrucosispora sp. NA02020]TBL38766.1 SDR family oxidoreductase [Verrucosispora sp. SN26_14.1]
MHPPILVTGGTGTLGRLVTPLLRDAGRPVRVLSRRGGRPTPGTEQVRADLLTGEGVERAVRGVDTVLHLAGGQKGDDTIARTLVDAARQSDVRHLVVVSVVGADRVPLAWLRSKLHAEEAISGSGLPFTILRAAQFHSLVLTMAQKLTALPVVPLPGLRLQSVDGREVAARLAELTLGTPAGLVPDIVGPQVHTTGELMRGYLRASGKRRLTLPVRLPGAAGRAYRDGANLTLRGATVGSRTWEAFLAEHVAAR